ncbi:MAG: hypothetical protein N3E52_01460 [Candidatus Bathyarchaeota archaeon]|nr:hypothetical protein [Candidatus Bathyarchaeota archaeon]
MSVIATENKTVIATIPLEGEPQGICYDSDKKELYVTFSESHRVTVISCLSPNSISTTYDDPKSLIIAISVFLAMLTLTALLHKKTKIETA